MFILKKYHPDRPRWSDEDRHFGPFCFSRTHQWFGVSLRSHDDGEDTPHNVLQLSLLRRTVLLYLPAILKPLPNTYGESEQEYAITCTEGCMFVRSVENNAQHVSIFDFPSQEYVSRTPLGSLGDEGGAEQSTYELLDYDGTPITVQVTSERLVFLRYGSWLRWLGRRLPRKTTLRANLQFSGETGKGKHEWKGGTLATTYTSEFGRHSHIILDYATRHKMTNVHHLKTEKIDDTTTFMKPRAVTLRNAVRGVFFFLFACFAFIVSGGVFLLLLLLWAIVTLIGAVADGVHRIIRGKT